MNLVWNFENVKVFSVSMNRWDGNQMWTSGMGTYDRNVGRYTFQWEAIALQGGWYIVITTDSGKRGEFQGFTFNLPLEIAAAARRIL